MTHDVFISHSSKDKSVADAVTTKLEQTGYRCWIAPRDILPGDSWSGSIVRAIEECSIMVVIFSRQSNASQQVVREVERAINSGATVIPLRIDDTLPTDDLSYFLSSTHWMDAIGGPKESKLSELVGIVGTVISKTEETSTAQITAKSGPESGISAHAEAAEKTSGFTISKTWLGVASLLLIGIGTLTLFSKHFTKFELGVYQSNWGRITFYDNNTRAEYPANDNGRIVGEFDKNSRTFNGFWIENKADRNCAGLLDGSIYWGRVELKFERDFSQFKGNWSYCDELVDPKRIWEGKR